MNKEVNIAVLIDTKMLFKNTQIKSLVFKSIFLETGNSR
jgi:hypothetical protein